MRRPLLVVLAAALVSTAVRVWLAQTYFGFHTGDDVEIAQEALRRVGLAYEPWNIRNLLVPDLVVAPLLHLARLAGVHDFPTLATIARYPFIILSGVNVALLFLVGQRLWARSPAARGPHPDQAEEPEELRETRATHTAALAAVLYSFHWLPLVFGSSLYPRTVAVTCILLAALTPRAFVAGLLAAVAFAARYSEIVFLAPLLLLHDRKRLLAGFAAGTLVFAGLYDWATWGSPFASLRAFFDYTFVERASSSRIGAQAPLWYAANLPFWLAPTLWPFVFRTWRSSRARVVAFVVVPVALLSVVHHKELRYLQVVVPFALLLASDGAMQWWREGRRRVVVALLVLTIPIQLARTGGIARRSNNAVLAAEWLAFNEPKSVVVSQSWAYGGRIWLGNDVRLTDAGTPPDVDVIRKGADCVALYRSEVTPEIEALLGGHRKRVTFDYGSSRAVSAFCR